MPTLLERLQTARDASPLSLDSVDSILRHADIYTSVALALGNLKPEDADKATEEVIRLRLAAAPSESAYAFFNANGIDVPMPIPAMLPPLPGFPPPPEIGVQLAAQT